MVARLGGDELLSCWRRSTSRRMRRPWRPSWAVPAELVHIQVTSPKITASIGISCFLDDAGSAEVLVQQADAAMYSAKRKAGNISPLRAGHHRARHAAACDGERPAQRRRARRTGTLLSAGRYQTPAEGRFVGLEALLCWRHPERGMLLPGYLSRSPRKPAPSTASAGGCFRKPAGSFPCGKAKATCISP